MLASGTPLTSISSIDKDSFSELAHNKSNASTVGFVVPFNPPDAQVPYGLFAPIEYEPPGATGCVMADQYFCTPADTMLGLNVFVVTPARYSFASAVAAAK